jgi:DNA-directed RNA polymerase specialized sigma24 family protein
MRVDRDAEFRDFVLKHSPALLRGAHALLADRASAEDLAQNALVRIYTAWTRVRVADDPIAYAHKILFNSYRQLSRRRRIVEVFGARSEREFKRTAARSRKGPTPSCEPNRIRRHRALPPQHHNPAQLLRHVDAFGSAGFPP